MIKYITILILLISSISFAQIPQNYYDNDLWNLDWDTVPTQVALLLVHIAKIPAYQLT